MMLNKSVSRCLQALFNHLSSLLHLNAWVYLKPSNLETAALVIISLSLYARCIDFALNGSVLNPALNLIAAPVALLMFLWMLQDLPQHIEDKKECSPKGKDSHSYVAMNIFILFSLGVLLCFGALFGLSMIQSNIIIQGKHPFVLRQTLALMIEGLGLFCLWSHWLHRKYLLSEAKSISVIFKARQGFISKLHYPLSLSLFTLPWEALLRQFDESLQVISTDIAVYFLEFIDWLSFTQPMQISYWDAITIYSERFYLIINETCAGVNLLLSMSLYAFGFAWVMKCSVKRSWLLVAYMIPLCLIFNGLRITIIFCLGHFGDQALATGSWHEGSAYISQALLFILLALINYGLGQEHEFVKHDP